MSEPTESDTTILRKENVTALCKVRELAALVNQRHVSLWVYFAIAWFGAWREALEIDTIVKAANPVWLWAAKSFCVTSAAGLLAIKMVMSTSWASKDEPPKP